MRTLAEFGPLTAAVCSGLLETTARDNAAVVGWHEMLVETGLLDRDAVDSIFAHVETDLGLGHGSNWREAIEAAEVVPAATLAECLNGVTLVAEMIVRWLDTLAEGLATELVQEMPRLRLEEAPSALPGDVNGLPVWPSSILDAVSHGAQSGRAAVRATLAVAYAYEGRAAADIDDPPGHGVAAAARDFAGRLAPQHDPDLVAHDPMKLVESWMVSLDGHRLWSELVERPTQALVLGYLLENHHYVASIWQHNAAAIAACGDPVIRAQLVHHLSEEFEHGELFRRGIEPFLQEHYPAVPFTAVRPLSTTTAFSGALRGLAQRDWQAYVLALSFLQLSLRTTTDGDVDHRHREFYERIESALPQTKSLLAAMRRHDEVDTTLGHGSDTHDLLAALVQRHTITDHTIRSAALVPQLAWSFLDGIRYHYATGDPAVVQRIGWHVR